MEASIYFSQKLLQSLYDYHRDGYLIRKSDNVRVGTPSNGRLNTWVNPPGQPKKCCYIHRLVWAWHGKPFVDIVDHVNRNPLDNRIENLREATASQSSANRSERNSSGFRGVDKLGNRWRAKIRWQNKHIHIGYFNTPEEAHQAYCKKAAELHGNFAVFEAK